MKKFTFSMEGFIACFLVIFAFVAFLVPDDALFKQIFAYISGLVLVLMMLWFTPLANPIKKFMRKKGWL